MKLPSKLLDIEGIHHAIYADDITIWTNTGSDGEVQEKLQSAVNTVQEYAQASGLKCAPGKSELLLLKLRRRGIAYEQPQITLSFYGQEIPMVERARILGLYIPQNGESGCAVQQLTKSTAQIMRLIGRFTDRHHGLKESDVTRLIEALIIFQT